MKKHMVKRHVLTKQECLMEECAEEQVKWRINKAATYVKNRAVDNMEKKDYLIMKFVKQWPEFLQYHLTTLLIQRCLTDHKTDHLTE